MTALPWYRNHAIEPGWTGRLVRRQTTDWGSITRVHPFPGDDRRNLPRRALGFLGFSLLAGVAGAPRRRMVSARRRRDRDVAAAHARARRLGGQARAPGAAGVQHPGRVPRCRRRDRRHHRSSRHRRRQTARTVLLPARRRGDRVEHRSRRQRGRQGRDASSLEGPGDPELRRHHRAAIRWIGRRRTGASWRSATSRSSCTPATSASRSPSRWSSRPPERSRMPRS